MAGDIKAKYGTSAAYTITLNSLASSATWVTGRESTEVDNTSISGNPVIDFIVAGKIKLGTSPTGNPGLAGLWVWGSLDDTPLRPDLGAGTALTGSDAAATWSSANVLNGACATVLTVNTDNTTGRVHTFSPMAISMLFNYQVPKRHGLYFAHSSGVNLDSSAGGSFYYTPVLAQYT